jgi:hypothetical protein
MNWDPSGNWRVIRRLAWEHNWNFEGEDRPKDILYYHRDGVKLAISCRKRVVRTELTHPLWGKNKLYRKDVSMYMLKGILENPRKHTPNGYRVEPIACEGCGSKRCYCPVGDPHYFCDHEFKSCSLNRTKKTYERKIEPIHQNQGEPEPQGQDQSVVGL